MTNEVSRDADRAELDRMIGTFFDAFTSGPDVQRRITVLRSLFVPEAVIVRTCGEDLGVYDVDGFVTPRAALLSTGSLLDFAEWPVSGELQIYGDIAHWFGAYAKKGSQDGLAFTGRGMKSLQFVRTAAGWRISALAWDDEREGVAAPG